MNLKQNFPGLAAEPADLALWLPRGVAVLAAALGGLGVVMWIAANWESMGRVGHFALLQGLVLASGLGAAFIQTARVPLGLLAMLGIGALFAYFGLAVASITLTALGGLLFHAVGAQYPVGLLVMAVGAGVVGTRRLPDVFTLSALALGINALLVCGLVRWLGDGSWSHDWLGRLLLVGLFAAAVLAASVRAILKISRRAASATLNTGESA